MKTIKKQLKHNTSTYSRNKQANTRYFNGYGIATPLKRK